MKGLLEGIRKAEKPYRSTLISTAALLLLCCCIEVGGRVALVLGYATPAERDTLGLVSISLLALAAIRVTAYVKRFTSVRQLLLVGILLVLCFQILDVLDEIPALQSYAVFGKEQGLHLILERLVLVSGTMLFAMAFFVAVMEGNHAMSALETEHELLADNIGERQRAEAALLEARNVLEMEVRKRTSELAERNDQLQVELSERTRFEEALARKLRYEEGLAACSGVLLAGKEPGEVIGRALAHLLHATQCSRVYLFENGYSTELGPYAELTDEVWIAPGGPRRTQDGPCRLVYNQGLHRWREVLAHGEPLICPAQESAAGERVVLEAWKAQSLLMLPVAWEGRWRGFVGFDQCDHERNWAPEEVRMLRTAAEMFGACKERMRAETALKQAYDELEHRVDDRTSDLTRANEQLSREVADRRRAEQEKRKLEHQLRQAQKMQAIGTLAGGIAHDFNNILASIIGYTELGLLKGEPGDGTNKYFGEVLKAANRARELVRQILIFSRQNDAERIAVHPHLIVQEVIALMSASCPANIEIVKHLDAESGAVLSDPIQMHQVVLNLCTNAQHAMKRTGGTLEVSVDPIEVDTEISTSHGVLKPGNYVLITVSDTGHGMDAQTLERIFEPFFTTKSVSEGTGMGLAIVHGIVVGQGGAITVQSTPERGTSFQVYLPRHDGPVPQLISTKNENLTGNEHIMVVDDEPQLVGLWKELLEGFGYTVTGFSSSLGALGQFRDEPDRYDLVLLDQIMPGMTGAELAQNMLRARPGLPIIMATGFSDEITPETARSIGISDFVYKPILGNDLAAAVRKAIDRAAAMTN